MIEQIAQGQEGLDAQTWSWRIADVAACQGIEHPRGNGQLKAILELDDQTIRGLMPQPPDDFSCLAKEGMMMVTDTDYRRMMSSVEIPSATVVRPTCAKRASMSGRSRGSWAIGRSTPPHGTFGFPGSIWRRSAAPSTSCPAGPHPSPRRHTPMPPHATACPGAPAMCQPSAPLWAVAEIFRLYDETYRRAHPVPPAPQRVRRELAACRTAPLGGHAEPCRPCGVERYTYKACRNRHGPKCQTFPKGQWGEDRKAELLPVPYCHLVFTVPHDLNSLMLAHKRSLLTLLFNAAGQTLVQFGHHHLGGQSGGTMGLHTWDQTWGAHCHGHCLMAAGALAANGVLWSEAEPRFLLPVRALCPVLRGKFCAALTRVGSTGAVPLAEAPTAKGPSEDCAQLRAQLYTKEGGVHAKAPLAGPAHLLDDVGRYPQRVAIANHRLLDVRDGCVRFASRNRRP